MGIPKNSWKNTGYNKIMCNNTEHYCTHENVALV
jgi:hypothetical protein